MLRFTPAQQRAINAARAGYNQHQIAMAANAAAGLEISGNAAPVPLDAWRRVDTRATIIQRDILVVFNRLAAANTTPVGVGDLVSYFPKISDSASVNVSMDGRQVGNDDQAQISYDGTPIPVISSTARFGWRQMEVIRKSGQAMDVTALDNNMRKVAEKAEDLVLNGDSSVVVGGSTIYGLRTHPNRNTGSHTFTLASATGANWITVIKQLIAAMIGDNAYAKITVFLNYSDYVAISNTDHATNYPKTILQRLKEIEQIQDIVPASRVPVNEVIGIAGLDTGLWGSILSAMPMVTRPKFRANPEDDYRFDVMMVAAPQFRTDFSGQMPVVHLVQ